MQKQTVSGQATLDDTQDHLTGTYTMAFESPDGTSTGSSSGTLTGDRIQQALIAAFDAKQSPGSLDVVFKDLSTGDPTSWNWDFGDGSLSADQTPTHTYDTPGDYTVTLTVSNDTSTAMTSQTVTVGEVSSPKANFTTAQTPGSLEIKFTDTSTGGPNKWTWNFGDGKTGTKQNPRHTYAKAGQYSVKLTVSNAGGEDTHFETITVAKPPTAAFTISYTGTPLEVKFTDASKGVPATWAWDFGDGATSTKPNPRHTYAKDGTYTVKLTVTNGAGSNTTSMSVPATQPSPSESPSPSGSTAP
jgi:PKD repeat protein